MRKGFLGLFSTLVAGAATVLAQPPALPPAKTEPLKPVEKLQDPALGKDTRLLTRGAPDVPALPDFPCYSAGSCENTCRFGLEYLLWGIQNGPQGQPLVTTSPTGSGGILFNPGVVVLSGGKGIDYEAFSGLNFTIGRWLNSDQTFGIEGSIFYLEESSAIFVANSDVGGNPLLARPIVNAQTGDETSILISAPDRFAGGVTVTGTSQLWGAEANFLAGLLKEGTTGIDLLVGYRYLGMDEDLDIRSQSRVLAGGVSGFGGAPVLAPNSLAIRDTFTTVNHFNGGQIGARGTLERGPLRVDVTGKVAFGAVHQEVRIAGFTTLVTPAGVAGTLPGGVLALPTNIGTRSNTDFSVVPEGQIRLAYQITPRLSASLAYTIIYWDNVVRPGDQLVRRVNLLQVPSSLGFGPLVGPRQPAPAFNDTRFWAQGVNFGLGFRF